MKYFLLLILFCNLSLGHTLPCTIYLASVTDRSKTVPLKIVSANNVRYTLEDPSNPELNLDCHLSKGVLTFTVRKVNRERTHRGDWKASEAFDLALAHFGDRVQTIKGVWFDSDNSRVFFDEIAKGSSSENAAIKTWTGQQAIKHGYTKIKVTRVGMKSVVATFSKP